VLSAWPAAITDRSFVSQQHPPLGFASYSPQPPKPPPVSQLTVALP
jgi:hypothetical protein